jgi:RsiW-degrading membrane proteinase PrsW (M82 family)
MFVWSFVGPYYFYYILGRHGHRQHQFQIFDCLLMLLTFVQSFALLGVWTYFLNRIKSSELSLDAIIKYFSAGFFLSASLALFWEVVAAAIINTFVSLLLAILGVDRVGDPQSDQSGGTQFGSASFLPSFSSRPSLLSRLYGYSGMDDPMSVKRPDYATVFGMDHPLLYTIYILFATFIVAGFIEELCKYFGYRMVEHPDFFTREELEEASMIVQSSSFVDEDDGEEQGRADRVDLSQPAVVNFSKQRQSIQAQGAAITLAMVSVAIGFSCCENLIYIFFYAGNSLMLELGVLIERSCFPVHPILAAIQSIRVCERDLEGSRTMKLGRIILPAMLFHGTFDFFIVFISFIGRLVGQGVEDGDLRISNKTEFLSVVSCVVVMSASLMYLYNESGKQRERLAGLDFESTVDRSSLL